VVFGVGARALSCLTLLSLVGLAAPAPADAPAMALVMAPAHGDKYEHWAFASPHAVRCGARGEAVVEVKVDPDGLVSAASIVRSSSNPELDVIARQAASGWRYPRSKTALRREAEVVFDPGTPEVTTGECSSEATRAHAKALAEAPMVNPSRMPKGMSPPMLRSPNQVAVDVDPNDSKACSEDATTLTMNVVIAADGKVREVESWEPAEATPIPRRAHDLAGTLLFRPAKRNGKPVAVTMAIFVTPRPAASRCRLLVE
jgi:TonB family protein